MENVLLSVYKAQVRINNCKTQGYMYKIGEQRTSEEVDRKTADGEEITEMISSCKGVFRTLLERHFPVSDRNVFYILENMYRNFAKFITR